MKLFFKISRFIFLCVVYSVDIACLVVGLFANVYITSIGITLLAGGNLFASILLNKTREKVI